MYMGGKERKIGIYKKLNIYVQYDDPWPFLKRKQNRYAHHNDMHINVTSSFIFELHSGEPKPCRLLTGEHI